MMGACDPAKAERISSAFNRAFHERWNTVMSGGGDEPLYLPAIDGGPARIVFTRDYASSALHEAAHWCIAGSARRERVDYGYEYQAPPRSSAQARRFFRLETRCQALELLFSRAADQAFTVSVDDLDASPAAIRRFERAVREAAERLRFAGLPPRAALFRDVLQFECETVVSPRGDP